MNIQSRIYLVLAIVTISVYLTSFHAIALEPETTETPAEQEEEADGESSEDSLIQQRINDLKERLATRVAELQSINKRSFYGILKEKSDTKFTVTYKESEKPVATDTETKFYTQNAKMKRTDTALDSLEPGQSVTVFGSLDLDQKTVIAQTVIAQEIPKTIFGTVTDIDNSEGTFTVAGDTSTVFDYEIATTCSIFSRDEKDDEKNLDSCGLSKMSIDDTVIVRGQPDATSLSRAKALRILIIPSEKPASSPTESL